MEQGRLTVDDLLGHKQIRRDEAHRGAPTPASDLRLCGHITGHECSLDEGLRRFQRRHLIELIDCLGQRRLRPAEVNIRVLVTCPTGGITRQTIISASLSADLPVPEAPVIMFN